MNEDDRILARQVQRMLDRDPRFANYQLKAEVRDGTVTVTGVVDVLAEREALDRLLRESPVRAVENAVTISTDGAARQARSSPFNSSMNFSTNPGSNWVPAHLLSSATASAWDNAFR